jgi:hypothetical protein
VKVNLDWWDDMLGNAGFTTWGGFAIYWILWLVGKSLCNIATLFF